ncbi:MAG: hypothetical protein ACFCD0_17070, partial [Gemmataceae bacterium]
MKSRHHQRPYPARSRKRRDGRVRLRIESLESRTVPTNGLFPPLFSVVEIEGNDTVDVAQQLGTLTAGNETHILGEIGNANDPQSLSDVDWFRFVLDEPTQITITTENLSPNDSAPSILHLFQEATLNDFDIYNTLGQIEIATTAGQDNQEATIQEILGKGIYHIAVSGSDNTVFHPYLADSGAATSGGDYEVVLQAEDPRIETGGGPVVLEQDPDNAVFPPSPFILRVPVDGLLDQSTISFLLSEPNSTIELIYNPTGEFGNGADQPISLQLVYFNAETGELQIIPGVPQDQPEDPGGGFGNPGGGFGDPGGGFGDPGGGFGDPGGGFGDPSGGFGDPTGGDTGGFDDPSGGFGDPT